MLWQVLTHIGLTEKEGKVYLTLLKFGTQPASVIAKKSNLNRTTCYVILDELKSKGIVSSFSKQGIKYFTPSPPDSLNNYLDNLEKDLSQKKTFLKNNMPLLVDISKKLNIKPKVQFFEGIEGIKSIYLDTLKNSNEILSFWAVDELPKELQNFLYKKYIPERAKKNIPIKVIAPDLPEGNKIKKRDTEENRKTMLSPKEYLLNIEINIYENKVAFMSYSNEEYAGVIIENERISNSVKNIFKMVWLFCSKLDINA